VIRDRIDFDIGVERTETTHRLQSFARPLHGHTHRVDATGAAGELEDDAERRAIAFAVDAEPVQEHGPRRGSGRRERALGYDRVSRKNEMECDADGEISAAEILTHGHSSYPLCFYGTS